MELITKEIEAKLPKTGEQEGVKDPIAYAKFFTPWTGWTWYAFEYDPNTRNCFGYVIGTDDELGYFNVDELESIQGPFGLGIERDIFFEPTPYSELKISNRAKGIPA